MAERQAPARWATEEARVRWQMRKALRKSLDLSRKVERVAYDVIRSTTGVGSNTDLFHAHATLSVRCLQDLRVAGLAAMNGYVMQSWTVSASAFESANLMGFLAMKPERATAWLGHRDLTSSFINVKDSIRGTLIFLNLGESTDDRDDMVEREYDFYGRLCVAKHLHPASEQHRYWVPAEGSTRLLFTPIWTPGRARQAQLGLALANRAAAVAIWVYAKSNLTDYSGQPDVFAELAAETVEGLRTWRDVDSA